MKVLDWYIFKKFISTFIFTMLMFIIIAVAVDTSEKADDFVRSGLGSWDIVTHYYLGFVPFIMSMIFPLIVFIAVIYFTSKMAGKSEFVAILAGGVKYNRMLWPFLVASFLLGGIFWLASQFWIPRAMVIRANFQSTYIDRNSTYNGDPYKTNNFYLRVDAETYVGMRFYDTTNKTASSFFLCKIKNNQQYYNLRAETIRWDTAKKNWKLSNAIERHFNGLKESATKLATMNINLNVVPKELRRDEYLKDKLTTAELKDFIGMEEIRGAEGLNTFREERYRRDATPFSVVILTMIGAIVGTRKIRGGSGLHLAFGLITAAVFVVMDKFSVTFATKGNLHPMLAAWIPNIIFTTIAFWLYRITPK